MVFLCIYKKGFYRLRHIIIFIDCELFYTMLYPRFKVNKLIRKGNNMGYPKKHRGRRKMGSKKRRARKKNKKK